MALHSKAQAANIGLLIAFSYERQIKSYYNLDESTTLVIHSRWLKLLKSSRDSPFALHLLRARHQYIVWMPSIGNKLRMWVHHTLAAAIEAQCNLHMRLAFTRHNDRHILGLARHCHAGDGFCTSNSEVIRLQYKPLDTKRIKTLKCNMDHTHTHACMNMQRHTCVWWVKRSSSASWSSSWSPSPPHHY